MTERLALAIDGGGLKTDCALVCSTGEVLALVRGPGSSPQNLGLERSLERLAELIRRAWLGAGYPPEPLPRADLARILLSGLDFPSDEERYRELASAWGWAERTLCENDTFAILRAGSEDGCGVAVVCGSGINCVGVGADGRQIRFAAIGELSGDWGGGEDMGIEALGAAARSEDGRGPKTTLEERVPAHFGIDRPADLTEAVYHGRIERERLHELVPIVLEEAGRDAEARKIVDRLAAEIVAFARSALERLELASESVEVVLGGSILEARNKLLLAAIERGLKEIGPHVGARVNESPPIAGAALLALDELGASREAKERARKELREAVERLTKA
jgi:N-acetylglucosamine kinase-like BadF-type ATPase